MAHLSMHTIQHSLTIFPLIFQTIIMALMLRIGEEGVKIWHYGQS